ncbi:hypothetical protein [Streptomyces sp. NPDC001744]|uniref:hypothetical protein n=1 Tax=Streptomyces sp. NPDC001744 TaxID=3364606 RepID=UPI0036ACE983
MSAGKKLDQAFEKLGKKTSVSFELDLDADTKTLGHLDAESDPEPGEEIPDELAELISGAKISFTVESLKPLDESEEKDFVGVAMKVSNPSGDLFEYRVVGDDVYVRSDADALAKATGSPLPPVNELPPEAKGLKKVLEGEWVTFSTRELEKVGREMGRADRGDGGASGSGPSPETSLDAGTRKKLLEALRGVVAREVGFKTSGSKDGTEHVTATAPFRTLVTKMIGQIRPLAKDLPPGMDLPSDADLRDAPDAEVAADFTLKNGELTEVYVDLAKLAESAEVKKFGLVLRVSAGTRPTVPAGATELNLEEIMGGFAGALAGDGKPGGAGFPDGGAEEGVEEDSAEGAA